MVATLHARTHEQAGGNDAIAELNETDFMGRTIRVNEAQPQGERPGKLSVKGQVCPFLGAAASTWSFGRSRCMEEVTGRCVPACKHLIGYNIMQGACSP